MLCHSRHMFTLFRALTARRENGLPHSTFDSHGPFVSQVGCLSKYDVSQFLASCLVLSAICCLTTRNTLCLSTADFFCNLTLCNSVVDNNPEIPLFSAISCCTVQTPVSRSSRLQPLQNRISSIPPPATIAPPLLHPHISNICASALIPLPDPLSDGLIHSNRAERHRPFKSSLGLSYGCLDLLSMSRQKEGYKNLTHLASSKAFRYYG